MFFPGQFFTKNINIRMPCAFDGAAEKAIFNTALNITHNKTHHHTIHI
jgi:hypothetical protein